MVQTDFSTVDARLFKGKVCQCRLFCTCSVARVSRYKKNAVEESQEQLFLRILSLPNQPPILAKMG